MEHQGIGVCTRPLDQSPPSMVTDKSTPPESTPETVQAPKDNHTNSKTNSSFTSKSHKEPQMTSYDQQLFDKIFNNRDNNQSEATTDSDDCSDVENVDLEKL